MPFVPLTRWRKKYLPHSY